MAATIPYNISAVAAPNPEIKPKLIPLSEVSLIHRKLMLPPGDANEKPDAIPLIMRLTIIVCLLLFNENNGC